MSKAIFRFYEELNDLLPRRRQRKDFDVDFEGKRSVKDMIESLGAPHTEIDLILVNGESRDFSYILNDGDRISVYPVFESLNMENVTRLRTIPLRRTRFIADINLGDIVRYMRALGFDVYFDPKLSPRNINAISKNENRIILTKNRMLLKLKDVTHGILIRPGTAADQIKRIIDYLDIKEMVRPFSRCLLCNSLLEDISKDSVEDRIPPKTRAFCDKYAICRSCNKIYWRGTHFTKIKAVTEEILSA